MTNFELSVINAVTAANAASFITLCYTTTCGFPKKSGLDKVEKMVILTQAQVNRDYEKAVNNALKKQGLAPTFKTQAPRCKSRCKRSADKGCSTQVEHLFSFPTRNTSVSKILFVYIR